MIAVRTADIFFVTLTPMPLGLAGPVDLTICATVSKIANTHANHLLLQVYLK